MWKWLCSFFKPKKTLEMVIVELIDGFENGSIVIMEEPMTLERASELIRLIKSVDRKAALDLFCHFESFFKLSEIGREAVENFVTLCEYSIAERVKEK